MNKVIVTGGLGFIGSNLIKLLLKKKYYVINIDKATYASNFYNTKEFSNNKNYKYIKLSIGSYNKILSVFKKYRPKAIFNLAAETHVDRSIDGPKAFIDNNIIDVFYLLEALRKYSKIKRNIKLIHISTDKVFGNAGSKDTTMAIVEFDNDILLSVSHSWSAPENWPGGVYGMQIGLIGTEGIIEIDDMHKDVILASNQYQPAGYKKKSTDIVDVSNTNYESRNVDFLTSIPFGQRSQSEMWGPIREETFSWFHRLMTGAKTPHTTAKEGHENLAICLAIDLAAKTGSLIDIPADLNDLESYF